uniref:ATP-dependent Clp protease proteolytic subunit n=1 Tax=Hyalogonium fusiforme TaxID=2926373 RepID=A0A9E8ADT8_9CHLO|nr:ATP-dependent Clp protease proteolytic subunit [Hyalogonium fusiforme]
MPIGVPRIIYCWGEELPAQWTDIYNFIFRRRMVFLMQYLDDELCNQICGLLINIHMEDRSKELEKKEMERSGVFKSSTKQSGPNKKEKKDAGNERQSSGAANQGATFLNKKQRSMEDLLNADEDLGIEEIDTLEQYTLQKITTEWLNWNAQFFDYSDEPYLFYLAELLSKESFGASNEAGMGIQTSQKGVVHKEISQLLQMLKTNSSFMNGKKSNGPSEVYSPFRTHANFAAGDYSLKELNTLSGKEKLLQMFNQYESKNGRSNHTKGPLSYSGEAGREKAIYKFLSQLSQKDFSRKLMSSSGSIANTGEALAAERSASLKAPGKLDNFTQFSEKALSQRNLRRDYSLENNFDTLVNGRFDESSDNMRSFSYLDPAMSGQNNDYSEFRSYYRKQTERALIEEESKKVFVIINSFGGSVGNGVTVHDALQFIKAGSLTLGLGVAASAASLALAGGTIGERYVTEGCHLMLHQPESSISGQASDIWIDSQEIMKIRLDVAEIYSLSTYRPRHKILRDLDRDFYLTASEAIHYGLADEIATNEVLSSILEQTNSVWSYHDTKQQRLLETRESSISGLDTQTQN